MPLNEFDMIFFIHALISIYDTPQTEAINSYFVWTNVYDIHDIGP